MDASFDARGSDQRIRMKHTVFLSSTGADLRTHRDAVRNAIRGLDGFDCLAMEDFGARDVDPVRWCADQVMRADVFVGLVGHFFGTSVPDGRSFTEYEYDVAVNNDIPRLMFVANENFPMTPQLWESNDYARQRRFRERVSAMGNTRDTFLEPHELAWRVVVALHNWELLRRKGMRGRDAALPPSPSFSEGFPLQNHFTGREHERLLITAWFETGPAVLVLGGFGGLGKSSLAWVWLWHDVLGFPLLGQESTTERVVNHSALPARSRPDGTIWWSFYERPEFAEFLREGLRYLSNGEEEAGALLSQRDARRLAGQLGKRRLLVVLDGVERLLEAYLPEQASQTSTRVRSCADPLARAFLQELACCPTESRILLTTRITPQEIEKSNCHKPMDLGGLDPADAVRFLRSQHVLGSEDELRETAAQWDFHPLSLRLLAGVLVNDPELRGEIRHAPQIGVAQLSKSNPEDRDTRKLTHLLQFAYDHLRNPEAKEDDSLRELMRRIAGFQSAVTFERVAGSMASVDKHRLKMDLTALCNRGLLSINLEKRTFEMHSSVRRYINDKLRTRKSVYEEIWGHLAATRARLRSSARNQDEFDDARTRFRQAMAAGHLDSGLDIFSQNLFVPLFVQQGAYKECKELLERLGLEEPGKQLRHRFAFETSRDRAWVLNALGVVYARTGDPQRSRDVLVEAVQDYSRIRDRRALPVALGNLARTQILLGRLDEAEHTLQVRIDLIARERRSGRATGWRARLANVVNLQLRAAGLVTAEELRRVVGLAATARGPTSEHVLPAEALLEVGDRDDGLDALERGAIHALRGQLEHAHVLLRRAEELLSQRPDALSTVEIYRARTWLAADNPQRALDCARRAAELWHEAAAQSLPHAGNAVSIDWALGTSHLALAERGGEAVHVNEAEGHLVQALRRSHDSGYAELLPEALSSWARFCLVNHNKEEAVERATRAVDISRPYPLKHSACREVLARIQRDSGGGSTPPRRATV
ncbi:MAG: DUF4062 domain-containing protein [Deltaproteobacteria bacterium]|nr:MAG: DUF4062 domain-containing protein [Deltaproteobacteria bacterium]